MSKTAIVVGGGLAGVAASLALAKRGVQVQLLEARRRLGGRTGSFVSAETNEQVDYCQHVGMGCCTNLRQLIDWLGQADQWSTHDKLHFYGPTGHYQRLAALPLLPAPLHLASWLVRWPGLSTRDRIAVARGMLAIRKLVIDASTDRLPAEPWLVARAQTPTAIERFWRTIIVSALGEELDRVNLSAVAKVLQDGFLNHREAFHLLVPNKPLGQLFGTDTEAKLREAGVEVCLQTRVQQLKQVAENQFSVETETNGQLTADAIVVAVPWFRVASLIDSSVVASSGLTELAKIAEGAKKIRSSPISGIHTWWDRPWLDSPHAAIVGRMCQWVFPKHSASETSSEPNQHYYQIVVSASRQLPPSNSAELKRLVCEDLAAVFPKVREAQLLRLQAVTDPMSVFSVDVRGNALRPQTEVPKSNIWLAGDWVQTGWPATMEGAILSGWRAAESILASWGTPTKIAAKPLN